MYILRERVFLNGTLIRDEWIGEWCYYKHEIAVPKDFTQDLLIGKVKHEYIIDSTSEYL